VIAESIAELERKLRAYLADETQADGVFRLHVNDDRNAFGILEADQDVEGAIEAWMAKGKYRKLLELWARGMSIDWSKLYEKVGCGSV
jgi:acyl transferase domain-containing protein